MMYRSAAFAFGLVLEDGVEMVLEEIFAGWVLSWGS
jgi:hypothetical protein